VVPHQGKVGLSLCEKIIKREKSLDNLNYNVRSKCKNKRKLKAKRKKNLVIRDRGKMVGSGKVGSIIKEKFKSFKKSVPEGK
jgi:hypothetical protein